MQRDCAAFLAVNGELISALEEHHTPGSADDSADTHAGRDFWYTREGHGAGFWDGDWPEAAGTHLAAAADAFGPAQWYDGDNGKIWQMGSETFKPDATPELQAPDLAALVPAAGPEI